MKTAKQYSSKRILVLRVCALLLSTCLALQATDVPRRFAIESASLEILPQISAIGDGLSSVQTLAFIDWGSIQTNPPVNDVNEYTPFPSNSWWATFLEELDAAGRGLICTLELGGNAWAIERNPDILVQNPATGEQEPGLVRILPEYRTTWQDFIQHLLAITPQITHLQIENEPDNVWVHAPGYIEALHLAYDAVQAFNSTNPGRNIKVLAAGYNLADLIQVPEDFIQDIVDVYPAMVDEATLQASFPFVSPEVLAHWSRKLHLVVGVLSQEDPANPAFDILSVHHDRGRTYDSIDDLVAWYRDRMAGGVYGAYNRPIWVDDMSSNYHVTSNANVSAEDLQLIEGLEQGNPAVIAAYNAMQPTWLVRKAVGHFAAGIERLSIAYGHDIPGYFLPIWRYMGLFDTNHTVKAAYYTTRVLVEKLDGFVSAQRIPQADTNNYLYRFTFASKPDVFVAWRETAGMMDVSPYATGATLRATHLVTETTAQGDAIWPPEEEFPADEVAAGPVPVFLEVASALPPRVPIYRFWSPVNKTHFFTRSTAERDNIIANWPEIWTYEGVAWYAYATEVPGASAVYRFWSPVNRKHFFTISEAERDNIIANWPEIWTYEGPAWYARPVTAYETRAIYRFWSPTSKGHFFTISAAERDNIIANWPDVWTYEGVAYHAYTAGSPVAPLTVTTQMKAMGDDLEGTVPMAAIEESLPAGARTIESTKDTSSTRMGATDKRFPEDTFVANPRYIEDGILIPLALDGVRVATSLYDPLFGIWDHEIKPVDAGGALFVPLAEPGRRYWLAILVRDSASTAWEFAHGSWVGRLLEAPAKEPGHGVVDPAPWLGLPVEVVLLPTEKGSLTMRLYCPEEDRDVQTMADLAGGMAYRVELPRWNAWYRLDLASVQDGTLLSSQWIGHFRTH